MNFAKQDKEFLQITDDIISNPSFAKLKELSHHGINRYDHSLSVAYISYKIAKKLNLNYYQTARGGLLHDFFDTNYQLGFWGRFQSIVRHPEIAVKNSQILFGLKRKEKDIIQSHMFPFGTRIPQYLESWLVILVDKTISVWEVSYVTVYKMNYASGMLKLFLLNLLR